MGAIFVLAAIMALFGILGYLYGTRSAFLLALVIGLALLVIARAGPQIIRVINTFYRFGVAGLSLLSGEDAATALSRTPRDALIAQDAAGGALVLLLLVLIVITLVVSRYRRFRGPSSVLGLLLGLISGYLLGSYLLVAWIPELGAVLTLPFGLSRVPAGAVTATNISLSQRFIRLIQSTSPATLATAATIIIALIVIIAGLVATRGRGSAGSRGSGARQ